MPNTAKKQKIIYDFIFMAPKCLPKKKIREKFMNRIWGLCGAIDRTRHVRCGGVGREGLHYNGYSHMCRDRDGDR